MFAWLDREGLLIAILGAYASVLVFAMPRELLTDSWYALVTGRVVAEHGLVGHDSLTVMTLGDPWINQPWGSALALYALAAFGGLKLALLAHLSLVVGALAICVVAARSRGASPAWTAWVTALAMVGSIPAWQLRTQSFAYPLFAIVLWLLVRDCRTPSRRTLVVFPLLALWANLHGSVALGAGLVALRGLTFAVEQLRSDHRRRHWKLRAAAFLALPGPLLFASPYGVDLFRYYTHRPVTPELGSFVAEWSPTTPSLVTIPFYLLALLSIWVVANQAKTVTLFEQLAIVLTVGLGFLALRNIVWLPLAATIIVPPALETLRRRTSAPRRSVGALLAVVALVASAMMLAVTLARPAAWFGSEWSAPGAAAVARAAERDPQVRVWSSSLFSDWLLWEEPALAGRVAYDVRFGMLTPEELRGAYRFSNAIGTDWRRAARGYAVVVLGRGERTLTRALLEEPGTRILYRDSTMTVLFRPRQLEIARAESSTT